MGISVCTHSDEQLVLQWALLRAKPFQRHKGQSLLGYCTFSAFICNLVHMKLMGLDPAPPKSILEKIIQEEFEDVQYHMWSLFLLTEQVTSA